MEIREVKVSSCVPGGTAGAGAKSYRISLPSSWVKQLGLENGDSKAELVFDGETIVIRPKQSEDMTIFISQAIKLEHVVVKYEYYDKDVLCSTIVCDFTSKAVLVKKHTEVILKTAFGVNMSPSWDDFMEFLEERCVPKTRENVDLILENMDLTVYDPVKIVEITQGRMAEDNQWLKITKL